MTSDSKWKLAPCPFCGGSNLRAKTNDIDGYIAHIECLDCDDMLGPMSEYKYDDEDEAIADASQAWNRRAASPQPPAPGAEVVAAEAAYRHVKECLHRAEERAQGAEDALDKVEDLLAEFGAEAPAIIGEYLGERRHALAQGQPPNAWKPLPSDGTCVRCGAAPRNPSGLCATCVDEDAVRAGEVEDDAAQALWRQTLDQEQVPAPTPPTAEEIARRAREGALEEAARDLDAIWAAYRKSADVVFEMDVPDAAAKSTAINGIADVVAECAASVRSLAKPPGETGAADA
jgi:hypothetical protein